MNKTHSTNIGGTIFNVEEDAYQQLTAYLAAVQARFRSYPDVKDIIADIEGRIAEHLVQKGGAPRIVTKDDVTRVIAAMGSVDQFGDDVLDDTRQATGSSESAPGQGASTSGIPGTNSATPPYTEGIAKRRLMRDRDQRIIAGVASGLSAYFDTSVTGVRLLFLASLFIGGTGLLLYFALWLCIPAARTMTDKLRMRGEPVTLDRIDQGLRDLNTAPSSAARGYTIARVIIGTIVVLALLCVGMCTITIFSGNSSRIVVNHQFP